MAKKDNIIRIKAGESGKEASEAPKKLAGKAITKNLAETPKTSTKSLAKDPKTPEKTVKTAKKSQKSGKKPFILFRPFITLGRYLHNSWLELRQVRWPNRKTTWSLVLAVLLYSAFFMLLIMALDALFSFIFNQILGEEVTAYLSNVINIV